MYKYSDTDKKIIASRVKQFENQVNRRLEGKLTEEEFKPLRLMNKEVALEARKSLDDEAFVYWDPLTYRFYFTK